jgi:hypothetical protein
MEADTKMAYGLENTAELLPSHKHNEGKQHTDTSELPYSLQLNNVSCGPYGPIAHLPSDGVHYAFPYSGLDMSPTPLPIKYTLLETEQPALPHRGRWVAPQLVQANMRLCMQRSKHLLQEISSPQGSKPCLAYSSPAQEAFLIMFAAIGCP